ncbi:125 kDa kinesin-related protein [Dendrobium catenatum]|uniref:125 kDa kinesin-related protein n=1 Tax=Dendrobium catenatum TaxID=906689 RepID=A0A2I0WFT7_9ASPA|nr:125 kDa kinesin-related protein [Dendrobium catenatum]
MSFNYLTCFRRSNDDEMRCNKPVVISCNKQQREVATVHNIVNKQIDKTFLFKKVFGPSSLQIDLFQQAVFPTVSEFFEHFSCTIFAYSQIDIGKTYSMEGGTANAKNGEFQNDVNVITRFVRQICDKLESHNSHYSMKVSFLEPYNEEIVDRLALKESRILEDKSKKHIAIFEDGGVGSVFKHPLRKFNIKAEQSVRQQQKVDMHMRSTQQFREFLARMKFLKSCMRLGSQNEGSSSAMELLDEVLPTFFYLMQTCEELDAGNVQMLDMKSADKAYPMPCSQGARCNVANA